MLNIKLLVQGVTWSIAILAMNNTYADDSSIMGFFNEKEAPSLETKVKIANPKASAASVKKTSNVKKTKLSSNASLQNPVENNRSKSDKTKQRKTHYGIGYEYRKSMREQVQRTERVERPEKTQRPERVERPERINRPERIERPDRPGRS